MRYAALLIVFLLSLTETGIGQLLPGTDKAFARRYDSLQVAANNGDAQAQYALAYINWEGRAMSKPNFPVAAKYFKESAVSGHDRAAYMYGSMCFDGTGITVNNAEGEKYLLMAANRGNVDAAYDLAYRYYHGDQLEKDVSKFLPYAQMAAEKGHSAALNMLGEYFQKDAVPSDYVNAVAYFKKAALRGDPNGCVNLGEAYENGLGVEKNLTKAKEWYKKGVQLNSDRAVANLNALNAKYSSKSSKPEKQQPDNRVVDKNNINPYAGKKICAIEIGTGLGHTGALNAYCETVVSKVVTNKAFGLPKTIVSSAVFSDDITFTGFAVVARNTPTEFFYQVPYDVDKMNGDHEYWEATNEAILHCLGNPNKFTTAIDQKFLFWGHPEEIEIPAGSKIVMGYQVMKPALKYGYYVRVLSATVSKDITVNGLGLVKKGQSIVNKKMPYVKGEEPYDGGIVVQ